MEEIFIELEKKHHIYDKGYVIFGLPGIGKTFNNKSYKKLNKYVYLDGDKLMKKFELKNIIKPLSIQSFLKNREYRKSIDIILTKAKNHGFKILCNPLIYNFIPDAIVIIPKHQYKENLKKRIDLVDKTEFLFMSSDIISKYGKIHNIPIFNSIQLAVQYCDNK